MPGQTFATAFQIVFSQFCFVMWLNLFLGFFLNFPGIAPGCTANCSCRDYATNLVGIECDDLKIESVPRVLLESMPNTTSGLYVCKTTCLEVHNKSGPLYTIPTIMWRLLVFFFPLLLASFASIRTIRSLQEISPLNVSPTEITWINTIIDRNFETWGCMECWSHLHRHFIEQAHAGPLCFWKSSNRSTPFHDWLTSFKFPPKNHFTKMLIN